MVSGLVLCLNHRESARDCRSAASGYGKNYSMCVKDRKSYMSMTEALAFAFALKVSLPPSVHVPRLKIHCIATDCVLPSAQTPKHRYFPRLLPHSNSVLRQRLLILSLQLLLLPSRPQHSPLTRPRTRELPLLHISRKSPFPLLLSTAW
jgi:hypothetical protein